MNKVHTPAFTIVVPCYNEEGAVKETMYELHNKIPYKDEFEIIAVNDGSSDKTGEILESLQNSYENLRVINHNNNRGYGASLKTGIQNANAELIVITDADSTYPNERIPELITACEDQDMVVGARTAPGVKYSRLRSIPKIFLKKWASWIAKQDIPDINSGLRVMRRKEVLRVMAILPDGFSFTTTITLAMLTTYRKVQFIPITYSHRVGKSKIQPIRDTARFIILILRTGAYFSPVRAFMPFIIILFLLSMTSLCYDIFFISNLTDKTVLLFLFTFNTVMFTLLADIIDKRLS
jgi:glycosyltransferase involved in cell wall biosynthesis